MTTLAVGYFAALKFGGKPKVSHYIGLLEEVGELEARLREAECARCTTGQLSQSNHWLKEAFQERM